MWSVQAFEVTFSSMRWIRFSAGLMVLPKGKGNSTLPHLHSQCNTQCTITPVFHDLTKIKCPPPHTIRTQTIQSSQELRQVSERQIVAAWEIRELLGRRCTSGSFWIEQCHLAHHACPEGMGTHQLEWKGSSQAMWSPNLQMKPGIKSTDIPSRLPELSAV